MQVLSEEVTVNGYVCGDSQNATIWRPDAPGKFPLLSYAHGKDEGGKHVHRYDKMMTSLAEGGFIVIASMTAIKGMCWH